MNRFKVSKFRHMEARPSRREVSLPRWPRAHALTPSGRAPPAPAPQWTPGVAKFPSPTSPVLPLQAQAPGPPHRCKESRRVPAVR